MDNDQCHEQGERVYPPGNYWVTMTKIMRGWNDFNVKTSRPMTAIEIQQVAEQMISDLDSGMSYKDYEYKLDSITREDEDENLPNK